MTVKESIIVNLNDMTAVCISGTQIKHCRKLINDFLKDNTPYHGGWTVWFESEDESLGIYNFKLANPFFSLLENYEIMGAL